MHLTVLRYMITIAEEQGFTKAADRLYVSQPSLSQAIRSLEEEIGAELFVRSGRKINLTPAGERFLIWAKNVLESKDKLLDTIHKDPYGLRKLKIGASPYRSKMLLPGVISRFIKEVPACEPILRDESETNMYELLENGDLDLMIDIQPGGGYDYEDLFTERVLVAMDKRFAPEQKDGDVDYPFISVEDVAKLPVIMIKHAEGSSPQRFGPLLMEIYKKAGMVPDVAAECSGAELANLLAAEGLGYTLVSELTIRSGRFPDLRYFRIRELPFERRICAIRKAYEEPSPDMETFVRILKEEWASFTDIR